jgi:hypothetical protein
MLARQAEQRLADKLIELFIGDINHLLILTKLAAHH